MSRCLIKFETGRLSETSGGCAGHGFPLRHCADPMDVDLDKRKPIFGSSIQNACNVVGAPDNIDRGPLEAFLIRDIVYLSGCQPMAAVGRCGSKAYAAVE